MMSLLNWLGETPAQRATATQPGYLTFGMSSQYLHRKPPMLMVANGQ